MIYIFLADGFEEAEALVPADILRRAGGQVALCGAPVVTGAHGIQVVTDCRTEDARLDDARLLFLPGGMPGVTHLWEQESLRKLLTDATARGILVAAICAAPSILGKLGLLRGRQAVCFPGFEDALAGAEVHAEAGVVEDGNIITAKAAGVAYRMGFVLTARLFGQEKADALEAGMYCADADTVRRV